MRDVTELMNAYRECARNLWNVYYSRRADVGASLDDFSQLQSLLFESLIAREISYESNSGEEVLPLVLKIIPRARTPILIERLSGPGEAGYWDQEKDMVVGPDNITLLFLDYFDFSQAPIKEFRFFRCKILRFSTRPEYEGRSALIDALDGRAFYDPEGR